MFPILRIGPAVIQSARLLLVLGFFFGLSLSERLTRKLGEDSDALTNLIIIATLAGLIAARLFFVMEHVALFQKNLIGLVSVDSSLLDPWGGVAGAAIASLIYGQRKHLAFWPTLDRLTPFFATMAVAIGLAHIASGQAFGAPTSLPWAIELWGARRQPSQFYETAGALAILLLLWKQTGAIGVPGTLFLKFAALTSGLVVFLSAFRGDSRLILGTIRQDQLLALGVLGLALFLLEIRAHPGKSAGNI
ncbi:MAG TPA: prolipoprotein diacylglyceryl transferase family protein [Anaerolineales bacterium]|nr:prolipoprotein diacylglyceryl transferase family protein [Anaerolineales bacterium]